MKYNDSETPGQDLDFVPQQAMSMMSEISKKTARGLKRGGDSITPTSVQMINHFFFFLAKEEHRRQAALQESDEEDSELDVPSSDEVLEEQAVDREIRADLQDERVWGANNVSGAMASHVLETTAEGMTRVDPVPVCVGTKWQCFCRVCHPPQSKNWYPTRDLWDSSGYTHTRG